MANESVSMDAATLEALRGSIAKWEGIVAGTTEDLGPVNCPLCRKFHIDYRDDEEMSCEGCPIAERTGESGCSGTPYEQFYKAEEECDEERMALAAKAELDFLKSLLPREAHSPALLYQHGFITDTERARIDKRIDQHEAVSALEQVKP